MNAADQQLAYRAMHAARGEVHKMGARLDTTAGSAVVVGEVSMPWHGPECVAEQCHRCVTCGSEAHEPCTGESHYRTWMDRITSSNAVVGMPVALSQVDGFIKRGCKAIVVAIAANAVTVRPQTYRARPDVTVPDEWPDEATYDMLCRWTPMDPAH